MTTTRNRAYTPRLEPIEQALRDSQARMSGIIASAMDAIITTDEEQRITLFNRSAEVMFGYLAHDVLGKPLEVLIPERFRARHRQHIANFAATGVTNRSMGRLGTLYGLRANGEEFPIEASISQLTAAQGRLFTVILRDVTERVNAEAALKESEQYLRATFDQAAVGIIHMEPGGRILRVNKKLVEITGYTQEELLARTFADITHPEDVPIDRELHQKLLAGHLQTYSHEKRYLRKDGVTLWVYLSASVVRDANGSPRYMIKIVEDITARKAAQAALQAKTDEMRAMTQQLWQTAKLATMGELAASIAHELNNPLAILSLRIESLLDGLTDSAPARAELEVMEREVDRMASLVTNLLQFSRSSERQISSLLVQDEIDQTLELVQTYLAHRRVTPLREFSADTPMIHADRQQLRQLFLNLVTNAADAMPGGGTLLLRVAPHDDSHVKIEVIDEGVGIEPHHLRSVMEPFFTTKPEGKGTGLGLAICRRIVEEHQGTIRIRSEGKDRGTTVEVILPATTGSMASFLVE